jgi:hypothetical protein
MLRELIALQSSSVKEGNLKCRGAKINLELPADAIFLCVEALMTAAMLKDRIKRTFCTYVKLLITPFSATFLLSFLCRDNIFFNCKL